MKTLVFDLAILASGPVTGVARAFLTTLQAYRAASSERLLALVPPGQDAAEVAGYERVTACCTGLARQTVLPGLLRRLRADLYHAPVAAIPLHAPCPVIATVHDLPWRSPVPLREPGCGWRARLAVTLALRRAARVLVPSVATAHDLGASPRVRLVPHGVVLPAEPAPEAALTGPFLVLGAGRPRKNLDRVQAAHKMASVMRPGLPALRICGHGAEYVSESTKWTLLRAARGLVHCPLFEGFGLPPLEAMAHGVPVLAGNRASLPEVVGGAALCVDPLDLTAIAQGLVRLDADAALRTTLRARGLARAQEFRPERSAAAWSTVHRELLG